MVNRSSSEFKSFLDLYEKAPLLELGRLADARRWQLHPENVVTYIIDRNINYTNVCVADCKFCAFYRRPKHTEGYVLSFEEIGRKIDELKALGGDRKSTRLNSSHSQISYAVFCLKKKKKNKVME